MKLAHHTLSNCLEWGEGEIGCLVVENPNLFAEFVQDITSQMEGIEGDLIFSENGKGIDLAKYGFVLRDIVGIDMNHKKISNAINALLKENALADFIPETQQVQAALYTLMDKLLQTVNYPLEFEPQCDVGTLIKAANVHCANEILLTERVLGFSLAAQEFLHTKLFVFVGLKGYLNTKDLLALYKDWAYKKVSILLLEPLQRECLPNEKTLIIELDFCELLLVDKC